MFVLRKKEQEIVSLLKCLPNNKKFSGTFVNPFFFEIGKIQNL